MPVSVTLKGVVVRLNPEYFTALEGYDDHLLYSIGIVTKYYQDSCNVMWLNTGDLNVNLPKESLLDVEFEWLQENYDKLSENKAIRDTLKIGL